jgi:signal peptidase I
VARSGARRALSVLFWIGVVVTALALVYAILRLTIFDVIRFGDSEDMWPNLGKGALVVVNRRATPRRGDLVVLKKSEGGFIVRRVVGLPGENLAMIDSRPYIDGVPVAWKEQWRWIDGARTYAVVQETLGDEKYLVVDDLNRRMSNSYAKVVEGGYYVLADHREHTMGKDSREFGPVPRAKIRGVVTWIISTGKVP